MYKKFASFPFSYTWILDTLFETHKKFNLGSPILDAL